MLSDEQIRGLWANYSPTKGIESFARSIEAEARKQDTELIRQMLDALQIADNIALVGVAYTPKSVDAGLRKIGEAIAAARARLENTWFLGTG